MINKGITGLIAGSDMSEMTELNEVPLLSSLSVVASYQKSSIEDEHVDFVKKVVERSTPRKVPVIAGVPLRANLPDSAKLVNVRLSPLP